MAEPLRKSTRKRKPTYIDTIDDYEDIPVSTTTKRTTRSKSKKTSTIISTSKNESADLSENSGNDYKSSKNQKVTTTKTRGKSLKQAKTLTKKIQKIKSYDDGDELTDNEQSDLINDDISSNEFEDISHFSAQQQKARTLTPRQRAMIERQLQIEKGDDPYLYNSESLDQPTNPKKTNKSSKNTEEEKIRKKIINQQRIQRKQEQLQESKMNVVNKLLYKNSTNRNDSKSSTKIESSSHVRYCNNVSGITLSYTADLNYPLISRKSDNN